MWDSPIGIPIKKPPASSDLNSNPILVHFRSVLDPLSIHLIHFGLFVISFSSAFIHFRFVGLIRRSRWLVRRIQGREGGLFLQSKGETVFIAGDEEKE